MVLLLLECKPLTALKGIYCCWTLLYLNVYWITSFFYAQISNLSKSTLLSGVFVYFKLNKNQEKTFPYVECFSLQWCNYSFMLGLFNHDISQWKKGFQSALCLWLGFIVPNMLFLHNLCFLRLALGFGMYSMGKSNMVVLWFLLALQELCTGFSQIAWQS